MQRNVKKIGLVNLVVFLVVGAVAALLSRYGNTQAGWSLSVFFLLGLIAMAVSYFQMRLEEAERLERLDLEEMSRGRGAGSSLFETAEAESFPARRAREQFDRFLAPAFTVLMFVIQAGGAIWLWSWLNDPVAAPVKSPIMLLASFAVFFLILFLLGKYSTNLTRLENQPLLRPGASYLVLGAYLCAVVSICAGFVWSGVPRADQYVARALVVLLGVLAAETLVNLVLEIYRPRVKGKALRVLYESRLVGLLAHPEGLFTTAAHALDYQFGFKVSETWFYRFLQRALAWLILIQLAILVVSTCFVFVEPGEQALIERFGRPLSLREPLGPGLHVKYPWPIDRVFRAHTDKIQTFNIGFVDDDEEDHADPAVGHETIVWTVNHHQEEFNLLIGSASYRSTESTNRTAGGQGVPADLISINIPVQYQIRDLFAWTYNYVDAGATLESAATAAVVRYLAGEELFSVMASGRAEAAATLKQQIQDEADRLKLGVKVVFVGVQGIHPPVSVASAFEDVNGASQSFQAAMHEADGYAARQKAMAAAQSRERVRRAKAYRARTVVSAQAEAAQFTNQVAAFEAAPEVFAFRKTLEIWDRSSTNAQKFIMLATNSHDVITIDLQEKLLPDMTDIRIPSANE